MADVLNLALKKEVFEGLKNGVTNIIPIEKTDWWKKRLVDTDTGRFKPFKQVIATCGSSDKFIYEIENIVLDGNTFFITVVNPKMNPEPVNPEIISPENITPVPEGDEETVTAADTMTEEESKKPYVPPQTIVEDLEEVKEEEEEEELKPEPEPEPDVEEENEPEDRKDIKDMISDLINRFCTRKDVFVVNQPRVTIKTDGRILGCHKRLYADRDNDVLFTFQKKEFVKHPEDQDFIFLNALALYLANLSRNNYVFINREACRFWTDEYGNLTLIVYATSKKKYLFKR